MFAYYNTDFDLIAICGSYSCNTLMKIALDVNNLQHLHLLTGLCSFLVELATWSVFYTASACSLAFEKSLSTSQKHIILESEIPNIKSSLLSLSSVSPEIVNKLKLNLLMCKFKCWQFFKVLWKNSNLWQILGAIYGPVLIFTVLPLPLGPHALNNVFMIVTDINMWDLKETIIQNIQSINSLFSLFLQNL